MMHFHFRGEGVLEGGGGSFILDFGILTMFPNLFPIATH